MADSNTSQTLLDGERNVVIKIVGILDTANASITAVDISTLVPAPSAVNIRKIQYSLSSQLVGTLYWDADTDIPIVSLSGHDEIDACAIGGLTNNAGTGKTGDIKFVTTGWASGIQSYTLILEMVKNYE